MDLPDCPPGAEGYEDTVVEMPKKPDLDDSTCTKAELEFKEHLNSLKIKVEDGTTRCMVERRGRDVSGKWIYLCYPCAAVCSGESILQTHISGKKHKTKLSLKTVWPTSIFDEHPYVRKGESTQSDGCDEKTLQKMADLVSMHNVDTGALDSKYSKYRYIVCQIQSTLDKLKAPLLGVEYLVEFPGEEAHHEPSYMCLLCSKQGAPRTIVNHMVSYWHRIHYLWRHFPTTHAILQPYRTVSKYREGVGIVMNRLVHRIEESYGRLKPLCIEKDDFSRNKEQITQWVFKGYHFSEKTGQTFVEVVDTELITSLEKEGDVKDKEKDRKKDPSPPVVAAPSRSKGGIRRERRLSVDELSDDLSMEERERPREHRHDSPRRGYSHRQSYKDRPAPYPRRFSPRAISREKYGTSERIIPKKDGRYDLKMKAPNTEHKKMLVADQTRTAEQAAGKLLAYHEKNPEKHPLYPEEWKKFWNRRYKELQADGKDASKHDFKPEWIVFWTKRMKELHDEELSREITEIHRRLNLPPPEDRSRRSPQSRRRSRSPASRHRERSPGNRRHTPRRHSRSPRRHRTRSPVHRSRSPIHRNKSPAPKRQCPPVNNPYVWRREDKKSLSPLSLREAKMSNSNSATRSRSRDASTTRTTFKPSPIKDTVLISDDELKEDPLSPWNGSGSMDSLGSLPDAKSPINLNSGISSRQRPVPRALPDKPQSIDSPDDVVSSLRLLVALEDYLGSLGPKVVDLLALALKMEKEKPNSSEQLLENELSVSLIETAKEKLKGAIQAGLVVGGAAAAARKAVTKAAALLHEADKRQRIRKVEASKNEALPVAGVGAVDKAAIAKQMAAALIAQGKTDVTTEELAQLVDAVVGMAEAKKREAEKAAAVAKLPTVAKSSTGSALQLLQSAYDENEKKVEKEEAPDVMDGLSDSDLKTLLQNFSELSAEEQHGLIAYLKKLEAKDPRRVEQLREYVSAAVSAGPAVEPAPTAVKPVPPPPPHKSVALPTAAPVTLSIDSEDDDYTVEEVFKSAAEKVKENQMRQEMEVVKKLLSQDNKSKEEQTDVVEIPIQKSKEQGSIIHSSAANVLALMQASVHSSTTPVVVSTTEVTPSTIPSETSQPKLFGDKPEEIRSAPLSTNLTNLLAALSGKKNLEQTNINQQSQNYGIQGPLDGPKQNRPNQGELQNHNYGNQGPLDGPNQNRPNQGEWPNQNFGNQGPVDGPKQNRHNQGEWQNQNYGNQVPLDGPNQNRSNQGEWLNQNFGNQGLVDSPKQNIPNQGEWQNQNYGNAGPVDGPKQNIPSQDERQNQIYGNEGPVGGIKQNVPIQGEWQGQSYSHQGALGGNQYTNQQEYGQSDNFSDNQCPVDGPNQNRPNQGEWQGQNYTRQSDMRGNLGGNSYTNQQVYGLSDDFAGNQSSMNGPHQNRPNQGEWQNQNHNHQGPVGGNQYPNNQEYGQSDGFHSQDSYGQKNMWSGPKPFRGGGNAPPQRGGCSNANSYGGNNAGDYSNSEQYGDKGGTTTYGDLGYQQEQYTGNPAPSYGRGGYIHRGYNANRRTGGGIRGRGGRGRGQRGSYF